MSSRETDWLDPSANVITAAVAGGATVIISFTLISVYLCCRSSRCRAYCCGPSIQVADEKYVETHSRVEDPEAAQCASPTNDAAGAILRATQSALNALKQAEKELDEAERAGRRPRRPRRSSSSESADSCYSSASRKESTCSASGVTTDLAFFASPKDADAMNWKTDADGKLVAAPLPAPSASSPQQTELRCGACKAGASPSAIRYGLSTKRGNTSPPLPRPAHLVPIKHHNNRPINGSRPSLTSLAAEAASDGRATWIGHAVSDGPIRAIGTSLPGLVSSNGSKCDHHALPSSAYHGPQPPGVRSINGPEMALGVTRRAMAEWDPNALTSSSTTAAKGSKSNEFEAGAPPPNNEDYRLRNGMGTKPGGIGEYEWAALRGPQFNSGSDPVDYERGPEVDEALLYLRPLAPALQSALEALTNAPPNTSDAEAVIHLANSLSSLSQGPGKGLKIVGSRKPPADDHIASAAARILTEKVRHVLSGPLTYTLEEALRSGLRDLLLIGDSGKAGSGGALAQALADNLHRWQLQHSG